VRGVVGRAITSKRQAFAKKGKFMNLLAKLTAAAGLALFVGLSLPALAQSPEEMNARVDTLFGEHETLVAAFDGLTAAVRDGDAETVAAFVKYPFTVTVGGRKLVLKSEQEFVADYDAIITPEIAKVVGGQDYGALFANSNGVMFGNGEMWLTAVCTDKACSSSYWMISAINQAD
jgi:hypothetical protein